MTWLWLALACAFLVALADALSKRHLVGYTAREMAMVRFGIGGLLLLPFAFSHPLAALPWQFWGWMAALVPLEVAAVVLYMRAIRDHPLSLTLPYLAFTPVFTTVTGYVLLGETVSARGLAGILLVVAGAWLLNLDRGGSRDPLEPFRAITRQRGARLMLMVAAIYSVTAVMGKGALAYMPGAAFGPFYFALLGVATLVAFGVRHRDALRMLARKPGWHLAIGAVMAAMAVTHFRALELVQTAYMITAKRTSLLFAMVLGALWFGERNLRRNLLAGSLMVVGVALVAL
ncbi:MAG TPA: DMT family transporter [Burkholderiales bacterium]